MSADIFTFPVLSLALGSLPTSRVARFLINFKKAAKERTLGQHYGPYNVSTYNIGLKGAMRSAGFGTLATTFLIDWLKGFLAVIIFGKFGLTWAFAAGTFAYLGHLYGPDLFNLIAHPYYTRLKRLLKGDTKATQPQPLRARGAGVLLGILLGLALSGIGIYPIFGVLVVAILVYALSGYAALASISLALGLAATTLVLNFDPISKVLAWVLFLTVLWRYKENIGRILDGVEPKYMGPESIANDQTSICAFLIHPMTVEDLWQSPRFRWAKRLYDSGIISTKMLERLLELFRPMKVGEISGVKTPGGRRIHCYLLSAPLLPHQIVSKPQLAVRRAIQGAQLAKALGAEVIGLGAFWSVVGGKGLEVQEAVPSIAVTNGGSLTAATSKKIVPLAMKHFRKIKGRNAKITAAVVGANGVVGFGIARSIAADVDRLILIGRDPTRLDRALESLSKNLRLKGYKIDLEATTDYTKLKEADIIFSATSDPRPVITSEHVKEGTWIVDKGVPPDVHPDVENVPNVYVIRGGVIRLPGNAKSTLDLHFGGRNMVPACLAETMAIAASNPQADTPLKEIRRTLGGLVRSEDIEYFLNRAQELGFEILGFEEMRCEPVHA